MKKLRILVTGYKGMLGTDLITALTPFFEPVGLDLPEFDITQRNPTIQAISAKRPDLVIHAAAFTDVDGCEKYPEKAFAVNALGTANVVAACAKKRIPMAYISTDFVFDGRKKSPYLEFDSVNPIQAYGRSKLAGEFYVSHLMANFFIIRTSWLFGRHGKSFPAAIVNQAAKGGTLRVVNDQIGSPTLTNDLCQSIIQIIKAGAYGIYHAANEGEVSRYDFARAILKAAGKKNSVFPVSSGKTEQTVQRPAYSALRNLVLETFIGFRMPDWRNSLKRYFESSD